MNAGPSNWTDLFPNFGKLVLLLQIGASLEHFQPFRPRLNKTASSPIDVIEFLITTQSGP
jgi:hypothetical protein